MVAIAGDRNLEVETIHPSASETVDIQTNRGRLIFLGLSEVIERSKALGWHEPLPINDTGLERTVSLYLRGDSQNGSVKIWIDPDKAFPVLFGRVSNDGTLSAHPAYCIGGSPIIDKFEGLLELCRNTVTDFETKIVAGEQLNRADT